MHVYLIIVKVLCCIYTFKQVMIYITLFARILDSLIWVSVKNCHLYLHTLANVQFATQIYIVFVLVTALHSRSIISTKHAKFYAMRDLLHHY